MHLATMMNLIKIITNTCNTTTREAESMAPNKERSKRAEGGVGG